MKPRLYHSIPALVAILCVLPFSAVTSLRAQTSPGGIQYAPQFLIGKVTHDFGSADIWEFFKGHPKP